MSQTGLDLTKLPPALKGKVILDKDVLNAYSSDILSNVSGQAGGVVRVTDADDVHSLVSWALSESVPIVARGGGSSLDGECVPFGGAVVVDFATHLNKIIDIDKENMLALVQPGLINRELNRRLEEHGLFFPPNPGSWEISTVGGNVSTNAAGPRSYRYGSTKSWVQAIDAVLGTGKRVWYGTRARKSSSGLDMVRLLAGSEGTLGIFTSILLRLAPLPQKRVGVTIALPDIEAATKAVVKLAHSPFIAISAIEFLDESCIDALNSVYSSSLPESPSLLMLEIESTASGESEVLSSLLDMLTEFGPMGEPLYFDDANAMWDLRGKTTLALEKLYGPRFRDDVAVPVSRFPELVQGSRKIFSNTALHPSFFGHAGDGNLHLEFNRNLLSKSKLDALLSSLYSLTVDLGGTLTGEHGIGSSKLPYLKMEIGGAALNSMRQIKMALDPKGILNPGKGY